jgi:hypothetical protein
MPENGEALELWSAIDTQWRVGGMGGVIGLDWTAVAAIAEILCIELTPTLFRKIKALERDFVTTQNEKHKQA